METVIVEIAKMLWAKSDPMLILCVLALIFIQRKDKKLLQAGAEALRVRLDAHLDPDLVKNPYPHPQCKEGETAYAALQKSLDRQHEENRDDHREIFKLLRGEE